MLLRRNNILNTLNFLYLAINSQISHDLCCRENFSMDKGSIVEWGSLMSLVGFGEACLLFPVRVGIKIHN